MIGKEIAMYKYIRALTAIIISIVTICMALTILMFFSHSMNDTSYNLSLLAEDGQESNEEKGWSVYTNNNGIVKELTPDNTGGYLGLDYAGQTFYFSRIMNENVEDPTLRIGVVNRTVSVFLDGNLIYTDCPDLDNRIGYLQLPMLEFDKAEPVVITLPSDYMGRTLTIAQSSPIYSEKQTSYDNTVYPCDTYLYCGYAYESSLISDTTKIVIPATLLFSLGLLLCILFITASVKEKFFPELIIIAIASFVQMCGILASAPFFYKYISTPVIDPIYLCRFLSISVLLIFFAIKVEKHRIFYISAASVQILTVAAYILTHLGFLTVSQQTYTNLMFLTQPVSFFALATILTCSIININKSSKFIKYFSYSTMSLLVLNIIIFFVCLLTSHNSAVEKINIITTEWKMLMPNLSLKLLWYICLISCSVSVIAEYFLKVSERRTEIALLKEKSQLAIDSYNNLRRQSEEIMMIRHDTIKHYKTIRSMLKLSSENINEYIDSLIGETQNIRSVVRSNNEILDILINGKLSDAVEKKIKVDIERSDAPKNLPISNTELCSLIVNILDNAINAALETDNPYIKLDFHCKNDNFIFICENNMTHKKKKPSPEHGYGLKIIYNIMKKYNNMVRIVTGENTLKISFVIPLTGHEK